MEYVKLLPVLKKKAEHFEDAVKRLKSSMGYLKTDMDVLRNLREYEEVGLCSRTSFLGVEIGDNNYDDNVDEISWLENGKFKLMYGMEKRYRDELIALLDELDLYYRQMVIARDETLAKIQNQNSGIVYFTPTKSSPLKTNLSDEEARNLCNDLIETTKRSLFKLKTDVRKLEPSQNNINSVT